jgi:hypothetical protein
MVVSELPLPPRLLITSLQRSKAMPYIMEYLSNGKISMKPMEGLALSKDVRKRKV